MEKIYNKRGLKIMPKKIKVPSDSVPNTAVEMTMEQQENGNIEIITDQLNSDEVVHINSEWFKAILEETDWDNLSSDKDLISVNFCTIFTDMLNWEKVTITKVIEANSQDETDYSFFKIFKHKLDWVYITNNLHMTNEFMLEMREYVNWDIVSSKYSLQENDIRELAVCLKWDFVCSIQYLSPELLEEFENCLNYTNISCKQFLPFEFIKKHCAKLNWDYIQAHQKHLSTEQLIDLSENYYHKDFSLDFITQRCLPEDFLIKYVFEYNSDSTLITSEATNKILINNKNLLSESLLSNRFNAFNQFYLTETQQLSETFIINHLKIQIEFQ